MTLLMAFPFSIDHTGSVATLDDQTDDYYSCELATLVLTHPGERELVPDMGCQDASFLDFSNPDFVYQINTYGPPVNINDAFVQEFTDGRKVVHVDFSGTDVYDDPVFTSDDAVQGFYDDEGLSGN